MGLVSVEGADGLEGKILQKFCWAYKHIRSSFGGRGRTQAQKIGVFSTARRA